MGHRPFLLVAANVLLVGLGLSQLSQMSRLESTIVGLTSRRFEMLLENLDEVAADAPRKTLFFGTSIWQFFLDPRDFDAACAAERFPTSSYNLSFAGLMGPGQAVFSERIREEFRSRNSEFQASFIELSPASFSHDYFSWHAADLDADTPGVFLSRRMWLSFFFEDPPLAAHLFVSELVPAVNWIRSSVLRAAFGIVANNTESNRGVLELWTKPQFREREAWNTRTRGLSNWNLPKTRALFDEELAKLHDPSVWNAMIARFRDGHGIYRTFRYDREAIEQFIASVKKIKTFSKHTYVVVFPYAPSFQQWTERYVDYEYLLRRVSRDAGVEVIDLRHELSLTDAAFADAMHARRETVASLLRALARRVAPDLRGPG